jgi:DNA-binding transcriptional regulator LsrR (DeoR family)
MPRSSRGNPDEKRFLSSPEDNRQQAEFAFLSRVCSRYYLEDRTQSEIAAEFGLSRQKVQRMIRQARAQGIVEIHVHAAPTLHLELERQLRAMFSLESALVAGSHPDELVCRRLVARSAADYMERRLAGGSVVAVGLGRNTHAVATAFTARRPLGCAFVSAMGGSPAFGVGINPNEVCSTFAVSSGSRAETLYAPAFVEEPALRDQLLRQPAVAETLDLARRATMAVIGIGTAADTSILVQAKCISPRQACELRRSGAVGEILGNFFDVHGKPVQSHLDDQSIGLRLQDLQRISTVVAVASEPDKLDAITGALRTGAVDVLVTSSDNALGLLHFVGATHQT